MPDIRLQPIPALTYLPRCPRCVAGGVHIRVVRRHVVKPLCAYNQRERFDVGPANYLTALPAGCSLG